MTFLIRSSRWSTAIRNATGIAKSTTLSVRYAPLGVPEGLSVIMTEDTIAAITAAMPATMIGVMTMRSKPLVRSSRITSSTISATPQEPFAAVDHVAERAGQLLTSGPGWATTTDGR